MTMAQNIGLATGPMDKQDRSASGSNELTLLVIIGSELHLKVRVCRVFRMAANLPNK
jgi:hypothetical protein